VTVIAYRYSGEPMSLEDRFLNPLGFEVIAYQRNPEAFPQADPATQPVVPPSPAVSPRSASQALEPNPSGPNRGKP